MNRSLLALLALLCVAACHGETQPAGPGSGQNTDQQIDEAKVRSAMEGVWLFAERDTLFAGGHFDGIRFNAEGRWQTLDVLADGTVAPAQDAIVGSSNVTVSDSLVQTNIVLDTSGFIPMHVELSSDGQRMHWSTDMEPWEYRLERSDAVVSAPIPTPPRIPSSTAEALASLEGVWLFTPSDVVFGGATCDGIRFDATGRYQLLDVNADGTVVPAQAAQTGQVTFTFPTSGDATSMQMTIHLDTGGFFPVFSSWSADLQQMTWKLYTGPVVTLQRSNVSVAGTVPPLPTGPWLPTTQAEGLAAVEGVWLFPQRDMTLAGATADGIRFNSTGRWELLDVLEDGSVAPAQQARSGLTDFRLPASLPAVRMFLRADTGIDTGISTNWSQDGQGMSWSGPQWTGTLQRSSAIVSAPFPPLPFVPSTPAEALAAFEGVWLFAQRDTSFAETVCDGVRFDATGRWQTVDVLEDGSVVPATNATLGRTDFLVADAGFGIQLIRDDYGYMPTRALWNATRDQMNWVIFARHILSFTLNRSSAVITEPIPG